MRTATLAALSFMLNGCAMFQSRVDDETHVLQTASADPVWDLDLYELPSHGSTDSLPDEETFKDSGHYYSFKDRVIWSMIYYYVDSVRIADNQMSSTAEVGEWYRTMWPRISDSLNVKHPGGGYHRFEGELWLTGDTALKWLGDMDSFETCGRSMTLAQLLKPDHWYLFLFDRDGPTHTVPKRHDIQRRVSFYLDSAGQVQHWKNVRRRVKKMRIV